MMTQAIAAGMAMESGILGVVDLVVNLIGLSCTQIIPFARLCQPREVSLQSSGRDGII